MFLDFSCRFILFQERRLSAQAVFNRFRSTYQTVHAAQRVVGIVQGVGQLVDSIVGLTVAIETDAHGDAAEGRRREIKTREAEMLTPEMRRVSHGHFPFQQTLLSFSLLLRQQVLHTDSS